MVYSLFFENIPKFLLKYNDNNKKEVTGRFNGISKNSEYYYKNRQKEDIDKSYLKTKEYLMKKHIDEFKKKYYKACYFNKYIQIFKNKIHYIYKSILSICKKNYLDRILEIKDKDKQNKIKDISSKIINIGNKFSSETLDNNQNTNVVEFYDYISEEDFLEDYDIIKNFIYQFYGKKPEIDDGDDGSVLTNVY